MDQQRAPRTLLAQIIRDSDRTLEETCAQFERLAREHDNAATLSVRQLQRWMTGNATSARPASRRVAARLWGHSFHELLGPPNRLAQVDAAEQTEATRAPSPDGDPGSLEAAATLLAHESTRHAAQVGGSVDDMTLEQAEAEAWRLARNYAHLAPVAILAEARRARDLTYLLLERTNRPSQTTELYLAAGQLCGLMAVASFDLAVWDASLEQARAAFVYGEVIDHPGLRAWASGHRALVAYWMGNPHRAVALAHEGIADAPGGTATARLYCVAARAWSHIGDPAATRQSLVKADEALAAAQGHDDLHDGIAGEFGWGPSRHAACAGSALVQIGDPAAAIDRIQAALSLLPSDPHGGLVVERAYCDLAAAQLARRDLEAATSALTPVWDLPTKRRREGITGRLLRMERTLAGRPWQTDQAAAEIRDQIVLFNAEASGRALPAVTS